MKSGRAVASSLVRGFEDPAATSVERFGGKGARLASMFQAGFPVPRGCVADVAGTAVLDEAAERVTLNPTVLAELERWRCELGAVAVRSSAIHEDGLVRAGAGQFESVLGVMSSVDLERAVRVVLASQFASHAVAYWGPEHGSNAMAVVLQAMVPAVVSGVTFTRDPVRGDESVVVIEACRGLGTGVVNGDGLAERIVLDRVTYEIVSRDTPEPRAVERFDPVEGLVRSASRESGVPVITGDEHVALVETALAIEDLFGTAVDVEWSISDDGLAVLQARPITTGSM